MNRKKLTILESKAVGLSDGKKLDSAYRFVIYQDDKSKWIFAPEQSFNNEFNQFSGLPGWYLSTLSKDNPVKDELYIDMGQKWSVKGIRNAVNEALTRTK